MKLKSSFKSLYQSFDETPKQTPQIETITLEKEKSHRKHSNLSPIKVKRNETNRRSVKESKAVLGEVKEASDSNTSILVPAQPAVS